MGPGSLYVVCNRLQALKDNQPTESPNQLHLLSCMMKAPVFLKTHLFGLFLEAFEVFDIASARAFKKAQLRWFAEIYGAFSMFLESPKCRVFQKYRDNCEDDGARSGNIIVEFLKLN